MSENHAAADGTIRDARPGESPTGLDTARISLAVLNASHERFRIIKTYAQGGLGVVSLAHDIELDRVVAVKEMRGGRPSDDEIQRFLLEARLTGQLDHPGIPPVYALGYFEDGRPFYAMRLVDGVTLRSAIKDFHAKFPAPDLSRQRSMQMRQLIGAVVSICNTLRFAHSKGVLHRDIKPSNIMLGEYGETLLMDWGLAKSQKQSQPYSELEAKAHQNRKRLEDPEDTGTGSVMGTPPYMSPEQAVGDWDSINQRSEVYSVGATLYSVLTGKPPFSGQTREEILDKVRRGDFLPPRSVDPRVPPELNAICLKAMSLERGDRYADTGELATDIEHWLADESVPVYREPISRRWQRFFKAHQAWVVGLGVLTVAFFVGVLIGAYFVSLEHSIAMSARKDAEVASQSAQLITERSRELISRAFVTTFNDRIRNIPGTERTRLEVLEMFLSQFQDWSAAEPSDQHSRHELAMAIHERALIFDELNEVELAWADMLAALGILNELQQTNDSLLHGACLLDRMDLLADMSRHLNEFQDDAELCDAFAERMQFVTVRNSDLIAQSAAYEAHSAAAYLQLAGAKAKRGQINQAFEMTSRACSMYDALLSDERQPALNTQLHGGGQAMNLMAIHCHGELAKLAMRMSDAGTASHQVMIAESLIDKVRAVSPDSFELWLAEHSIHLLKFKAFGGCENAAGLQEVAKLIQQLNQAVAMRPAHRGLLKLRIEVLMFLVECEVQAGNLDDAFAHSMMALAACHVFKSLKLDCASFRELTTRARELVVDIARWRGDIPNEQLFSAENCLY